MYAKSVWADGGPNRSTKSCREVAGTVFEQSSEANETDTKSIPVGSDPIHFDLCLGLRSKVGRGMALGLCFCGNTALELYFQWGAGAMLPVEA